MNIDANNELNDQELTRVSNALDALQNHNEQPTNNAWEAIMEESTKRSRRVSRRTQLFSAAAAAAVILALTGGVLIVASNGGTKDSIKTVDKKKKDPVATSTTVPLTAEQKLLESTLIVTVTEVGNDIPFEMKNGLTGKTVKGFAEFLKNVNEYPVILYAGRNTVGIISGPSPSCDDIPIDYFNVKTRKSSSLIGKVTADRVFSPNGNQYAEFLDCDFNDGLSQRTMTIVNLKTGKRRTIKPETTRTSTPLDVNGNPITLNERHVIVNMIWVDENRFVYQGETTLLNDDGTPYANSEYGWYIADLRKTISLTNGTPLEGFCCGIDGFGTIHDAQVENGRTYLLVSGLDIPDSTTSNEISLYDLESKKVVWSKKLNDTSDNGVGTTYFGRSTSQVYGSTSHFNEQLGGLEFDPFAYDHETDTTIRPDGVLLLPRP